MQITQSQMAERLKAAKNIVVTAHVNPDGDAVGSALALRHYLTSLGKNVVLLLDDDIPANFSILPGYDLFCRPAAMLENIDLLVVLDASIDRTGRVSECVTAPVLNIDHHISNDNAADYLYLDAAKAATGEIIFGLLKEMQAVFTEDIAICLYTAIATDCGFFRYSNTTPDTMRAGAELLSYGVKPNKISEALEKKPLATVQGIAAALNTLELFHDNKIAIALVTPAVLAECKSTEGFIDVIRVIDGVDVAIVVKYVEDNVSRISMRSKNTDVSRVAMEFQGGGHVKAAGCTMKASLAEAKQRIVSSVVKAMEEDENA